MAHDGTGTGVSPVRDSQRQIAQQLAVFFDLGGVVPNGTFGNLFNTGFSLNGGLEYIVSSHFSAEGIFGYHHFPAKIAGDLNIYQFSVDGKAYLKPPSSKLRPFLNAGIGGYKLSPGSTSFGGNAGAGLLYQLTSRFGLQGSYNFHAVNTPGLQPGSPLSREESGSCFNHASQHAAQEKFAAV